MAVIPNVTTHGLMALDVYNKLEHSSVRDAIKKHPRAYLLGSNGPDILFYYKVFPWQDQTLNQKVSVYGNRVHTESINKFYQVAMDFINRLQDVKRKEILIAYLAGHLMHWSLDSIAHPFIFYRSGEIAGDTKYWHYRYESMMDALMVTYVKRRSLEDLNVIKFVDVTKDERRSIASFYQYLLQEVFEIDTEPEIIDSAIVSMKNILRFLFDPKNLVTSVVTKAEPEPWAFSSHIVNSKIDAEFDVLNLKKEAWSNPTDIDDVSNESFIELYDQSILRGLKCIEGFEAVLEGQKDSIDDILQDRQYDTGRKVGLEMKYYDSIYEK